MFVIMLRTAIEFALVLLLIYGFAHEKQVIELEQLLFKAIVIRYKLYKKRRNRARIQKNRDFRLVGGNGGSRAVSAQADSLHVA